jgi:dTDP-4-amino-4,6-dideoxygalactose transaminase
MSNNKVANNVPDKAIPIFKVAMDQEAIHGVTTVLQSGYLTEGPNVKEFEKKLGDYFGVDPKLVTTVNSATTGLTLALRMAKHMDEKYMDRNLMFDETKDYVLTSPLTCTATNWAILANNYKFQWVDVCPNSPNINLDDLKQKLTSKSKIILFVHWGGIPVDLKKLDGILDEFEKKHLFRPLVIEDCAHAFGSKLNGKRIGSHSQTVRVFSFQAIKHLTTGDGGAVIWPNETLAKHARRLRWFGIDRDATITGPDFRNRESIDISEFGYKWHMNDINAAMGIGNLQNIETKLNAHIYNYNWLSRVIQDMDSKKIIYEVVDTPENSTVCGWIYTLLLPNNEVRERFLQWMTKAKIQTTQVHFRNDIHSCTFANRVGSPSLPELDKLSQRYVCIPCGWWLTVDDRFYIGKVLHDFYLTELSKFK